MPAASGSETSPAPSACRRVGPCRRSMTRSGPLACEDGRGGEAVRDDVPQQVDLGGGVGAGAVAAQDVQVVEGEHVGGRARRRGSGRVRRRRRGPRRRAGGAGRRERSNGGRAGWGGRAGTTQRPQRPFVLKASWGRSEQVQRCSWIDGRRIRPRCPPSATKKSLTCALPHGHLSTTAGSGSRDPVEHPQRLLVGGRQRLDPDADRLARGRADLQQLAAAGDLRGAGPRAAGAGPRRRARGRRRRRRPASPWGARRRRCSVMAAPTAADRAARVNGSTSPVATSMITRWCPRSATVRARWVGSAASR